MDTGEAPPGPRGHSASEVCVWRSPPGAAALGGIALLALNDLPGGVHPLGPGQGCPPRSTLLLGRSCKLAGNPGSEEEVIPL